MPPTSQGQPVTGWTKEDQEPYCKATEQPQLNVAWTCLGTGKLQSTADPDIVVNIYDATQAGATIQMVTASTKVNYITTTPTNETINSTGVDAGNSMGGRLLIQEHGDNWYLYTHEEFCKPGNEEEDTSKDTRSFLAICCVAKSAHECTNAYKLPTYSAIKKETLLNIGKEIKKGNSVSEIYTGFS